MIGRRVIILVFALLVVLIALVIGVYIAYFHDHTLATTPAEWGPFGDYVGGLLNPVLSFFAFIALLMTLKQNHDTNIRQWAYLEKIERKKEWLSLIEQSERQMDQFLRQHIRRKDGKLFTVGDALQQVGSEVHESGKSADLEYASLVFAKNYEYLNPQYFYPLQSIFEAFSTYVDRYASYVLDEDADEIVSHYVSSYIGYVAALQWIGMMKGISGEKWERIVFWRRNIN
jgi:uncharacterized membrane protein